jgi:hypothetical protein
MDIERHYFGLNVIIFGVGVTIGVTMTVAARKAK